MLGCWTAADGGTRVLADGIVVSGFCLSLLCVLWLRDLVFEFDPILVFVLVMVTGRQGCREAVRSFGNRFVLSKEVGTSEPVAGSRSSVESHLYRGDEADMPVQQEYEVGRNHLIALILRGVLRMVYVVADGTCPRQSGVLVVESIECVI